MAGVSLRKLSKRGLIGGGLVALGVVLVGSSLAYYAFARHAEAGLGNLVTGPPSGAAPVDSLPDGWRIAQSLPPLGSQPPPPGGSGVPTRFGLSQAVEPGADQQAPPKPVLSTDPRFRWVDWSALPATAGLGPKPTRLVIPSIGVDSAVVEVAIVTDGDQQVWQRPKKSVGHHVGTAQPGEAGNVVLSGHINSPIRGEGSVFKRLPEIPDQLRGGEPVEAFVYTPDATYVYRIVKSDVVEPDETNPFAPVDQPTLTLITCVPDLVFSHRLVVTGLLVKVADGGAPSAGQKVEGGVVVAPGR